MLSGSKSALAPPNITRKSVSLSRRRAGLPSRAVIQFKIWSGLRMMRRDIALNSSGVSAPNIFVPLGLHADGQFIGENPVGERFEREFLPDGREQDRAGDLMDGDGSFGPIVISPVADDELQFVLLVQMPEVI